MPQNKRSKKRSKRRSKPTRRRRSIRRVSKKTRIQLGGGLDNAVVDVQNLLYRVFQLITLPFFTVYTILYYMVLYGVRPTVLWVVGRKSKIGVVLGIVSLNVVAIIMAYLIANGYSQLTPYLTNITTS